MNFKQLTLLKVSEEVEADTGYVVQVFAEIEDVPPTGLPLTAELGGQPLEGLSVEQAFEPILSGYLTTLPQAGDELVIKIGKLEFPTGLTVDNPPFFA